MRFDTPLPIDAVLKSVRTALHEPGRAVLVAPPGAGKTTRVPLALLDEPWLAGRRIIVLEPRRIAARGAADRMALTLGERTGERVGIRARNGTRVSARTRIEVVTEGVFTRMILDDPSLEGVGAVLFDEFHERSLDADLGLALVLDAASALRPDLRLLVMSATLDGARVAKLLGDAPVIASEGRSFPVTTRHLGRDTTARIEDQMTAAILTALAEETGSVLAFLPGQGEIARVAERLGERIGQNPSIQLAPLYGALTPAEQDATIAPSPAGTRKIVLATSIAETSLTIEGVRIVVDSGLSRVPRYEPDAGVTRLSTVRVSRASADQRRGRAGRTEPGVCYRLWDEPQTASLAPFAEPEIKAADLSGLVLDCAEWGVADPATLSFLDPPGAAALEAAREELSRIGALDDRGHITPAGKDIRALPLPPRLARMVVAAAGRDAEQDAADLAAVLVERGLGGKDPDLAHRLAAFRHDRSPRAQNMRRMAEGWARTARQSGSARSAGSRDATGDRPSVGALLALAYPERIGKARGSTGQFLLANGRGANLDAVSALARETFIVAGELQGTAAATRILSAAALGEQEVVAIAKGDIREQDELFFEREPAALRARRTRRLGAIVLSSEPLSVRASEEAAAALGAGIAALGVSRLPWAKAQLQLRDRIAFLKRADPQGWPDLSDETLAATIQEWLVPYLGGKTRLGEISAEDLGAALDALVPWALRQRLEAEAPTHFEAPTGNRHPIDYEGAGAPALHIRVQELFGLKEHPAIASGKLPLTLNLLSPAHRPIQITRDLPGFWAGSWGAVKSEMKGRYPKHVWPDDPANAKPTARAKPRGT